MSMNPSNPPIPPTPGVSPYGPSKPALGADEGTQQRPFSLPPGPGKGAGSPESAQTESAPTPMQVARDASHKQAPLSPEEMQNQLETLTNRLGEIRNKLQNEKIVNKFGQEHYQAFEKVIDKMNPDLKTIAKSTQGEFNPTPKKKGESILQHVTQWIDGGQGTLNSALNYLSNKQGNPNPADMLKLQYAVQRASQRGELMASLIGAGVSAIKTIMSTQLG